MKPAEAATALRSAMMALIKPSQDLKKELHELGFESGPQMIAAAKTTSSASRRLLAPCAGVWRARRAIGSAGAKSSQAWERIRLLLVSVVTPEQGRESRQLPL